MGKGWGYDGLVWCKTWKEAATAVAMVDIDNRLG